ncbi:hypothetical protein D039_1127A, partial [Vibrio parahaemolyticus EKP-028]
MGVYQTCGCWSCANQCVLRCPRFDDLES